MENIHFFFFFMALDLPIAHWMKSILNVFPVFYATINVCCMTTALISLSRAMALWNFESAKNTFTWKKTLIYYAVIWIYSIGFMSLPLLENDIWGGYRYYPSTFRSGSSVYVSGVLDILIGEAATNWSMKMSRGHATKLTRKRCKQIIPTIVAPLTKNFHWRKYSLVSVP